MQPFALNRVPEIVFGAGSLASLGERLRALAGGAVSVLLVADPALTSAGLAERAVVALQSAGHAPTVFDAFRGEPKAKDIDAASAQGSGRKVEAVVGLGGGTALDIAKLVACCVRSGDPAEAYQLGDNPLPRARAALICVPTTAGTGSEATMTTVFTNSRKAKVWAWGAGLKPDLALLDPELTVGLPAAVTAATGIDALVHAIEASTSRRAFAANDVYCHQAIRLVGGNLLRAIAAPQDLAARGAMLFAATLAGIAIDNCGTAIAHNIAHALAAMAPIPHGRATAIGMAATMGWAAEGSPDRFAAVAGALGLPERAEAGVAAFDTLVRQAGVKLHLAGEGIDLDRPELLARHMRAPENAPMRAATARTVSDDDLLMLAGRVLALE